MTYKEAKEEFMVKVTEEGIVAALLPIQEHWLPLSNLDLLLPPLNVGVFFCYKKPAGDDDGKFPTFGSMVSVLKKALAQSLVSFYAFAGEVVSNAVGEPELLCNNRGVDFALAYADVELRELNLYNPDDTIEGKFVPKKHEGVLSVQVTELKCSGLVVACTFDHRVADAYSTNMFLESWAQSTKSSPSRLPSFRRSLLYPRRPGCYDSTVDKTYIPISAISPAPMDHQISRIYYVKEDQIAQLQSLAGKKRTKLESFSAFLWKTLASMDDNNKICRLGIVVDGRSRLGDMKTYFGNVLSIPYGEIRSSELRQLQLSQAAKEVHEFLAKAATKEHFLGMIDWVEAHRPEPGLARIYGYGGHKEDGPAVVVSSGQRFPVEKVEFGWGRPIFGSYHFPWGGSAGYVMPMPSPSHNGDWIVYMHMFKRELDWIETKAGHFLRPLTSEYLQL